MYYTARSERIEFDSYLSIIFGTLTSKEKPNWGEYHLFSLQRTIIFTMLNGEIHPQFCQELHRLLTDFVDKAGDSAKTAVNKIILRLRFGSYEPSQKRMARSKKLKHTRLERDNQQIRMARSEKMEELPFTVSECRKLMQERLNKGA